VAEEGRPINVERMGNGGVAIGEEVRRNLTLQNVRRAALHCMDNTDLQSALFEFNISDNDIGGDALSERIVLLLAVLKRDRALGGFIEFMATEDRLNRCLTRFFAT
jgi:hypothetical protein